MLSGEFRNAVDDKGRLMIPARLRSEINGKSLVMTRGVEKCIWVIPSDEWQTVIEALIGSTNIFQGNPRLVNRWFVGSAQEVEFDKSGRLLIAPALRKYAQLVKEAVILGINTYLEIWDDEVYTAFWDEHMLELQDATEDLGHIIAAQKAGM